MKIERVPVMVRLSPAIVEALDRRADLEQRSRANMATLIIRSALDESNEVKEA